MIGVFNHYEVSLMYEKGVTFLCLYNLSIALSFDNSISECVFAVEYKSLVVSSIRH
jgi:hypothetical protein